MIYSKQRPLENTTTVISETPVDCWETNPKGYIYNITLAPKAQGRCRRRGGRTVRVRAMESAVRFHLLEMTENIHDT